MQTSVAADVFPKLPAWEDMTAENKTQRCCKTQLASGTKILGEKYHRLIYLTLIYLSVLWQSIWQSAHADK